MLKTIPGLLCAMGLLTAPMILLAILVMAVRGCFNRARGRKLQDVLRHRGYTWLTLNDARLLYQELGLRAWQIPPVDEVGVLPGYEEGSVELLIELMERE